jgi:hypothetical protein
MMNLSAVFFGKFSPIFRDLFKMSLEDIHVA